MNDALLDILRDLARQQAERAAANNDQCVSVEDVYEINGKTNVLVEQSEIGVGAALLEEPGLQTAHLPDPVEILDSGHGVLRGGMHEKHEISEETPGYEAIVFGVPKEWEEALACLQPDRPPGDMPPKRWEQFIADARRLIDEGFAAQAAALGWTALDLFGCNNTKPFARIDQMGLVWLITGGRVASISASAAIIEAPTGSRQTYRRSLPGVGQVPVWGLCEEQR